jgi:hypothetical protein
MRSPFKLLRSTKLAGDLAYVNFYACNPEGGRDDLLWSVVEEREKDLRAELERAVQQILGPAYELREMQFRRGSVEMTAVLAVAGIAYVTISQYRDVVESISLFVRQARAIIRRFLQRQQPQPVSVTGSWIPAPAMMPLLQSDNSTGSRDALFSVLVWYLVISHFGMLLLLALRAFRVA